LIISAVFEKRCDFEILLKRPTKYTVYILKMINHFRYQTSNIQI